MAVDIDIAQTLYRAVDSALSGTVATGTSAMMAALGAIFGSFWIIQKTVDSINWWWNGFNSIIQTEIMSILKMFFICFCAFNISWYLNTIVPFINDMPTWAIETISTSSVGTNQVDALINAFINGVMDFIDQADFNPITDFKVAMGSILVLVCFLLGGIPFLGTCVATLLTLKVATTLFQVVGPLFIAFALFEQTRQYFWGWVSLMGGFMLTQIIFGIAITLEINFLNAYVMTNDPNGLFSGSIKGAFAILLYFGTFTVLATEIPAHAARVMGGSASGATGLNRLLQKGTGLGAARSMAGSLRNRIKAG